MSITRRYEGVEKHAPDVQNRTIVPVVIAGLDYLIGKRTQYYVRRQRNRTLMRGDRVAVLGRGIAVVEHADDTEVQALLRSRIMMRIARNEIRWDQQNMRWEAKASAP
jgi:hypothetical protein